jgi:uncharacterized LabA/DUF88 family protein
MTEPIMPGGANQTSDDPPDATLVFHEQADGRKVARLPGGKVVLVDLNQVDRVRDGDAWFVRLRHRDTFAIADPVERVDGATIEASGGSLNSPLADALRRARVVTAPPDPLPVIEPVNAAPQLVGQASGLPAAATSLAPAPVPLAPAAHTPAPATSAPTASFEAPAAPVGVPVDIAKLVRPGDRVALFVDGANTDGAARAAGYFVDFRKAREFFVGHATFYAAFYYVADFTASDPLQLRFFDFLSHAGYIVRRRPVKVIHDQETGERIIKGNLDTEIVLDMLNTVDNYDVAFLFSGDSDFERAVELLRSRGRRLFVVSARGPLSRELAYVADKPIIYLETLRSALVRSDRKPG